MSIIPDYAQQVIEVMRQLEGQAELTAQYWSDNKRKEYYTQYIEQYLQWLEKYVYGGDGMLGRGLNDLLQFISKKITEFEIITDSSITESICVPKLSTSDKSLQILTSTKCCRFKINNDVPIEQTPERLTEIRSNWTIDYNLNSPGNFSAKNLRVILNRHKNG